MTTSHQFWIAFPELTAYSATKGAIIGMVRSLARAVGKHHIRVNALAPGWVMTERQLREMVTPEIKEKLFNEQQILPMYLKPEDLAPSYLFLASDASRPITRQTLVVDAGFAMA
jgi:NAD(P)-dependent dehydrogenase (short-subunit alcohol dehydrogenase family)